MIHRRTARPVLLGLVVQVVLAAAGGPARAQEERPRVAILELEIGGTAPPELRPQLDASLAGGLYAAGYEVVKRTDVAQKLRGAPELVGCRTTTCLARVAELVGAPLFVVARVEASGAAYTFELELLDPEASSVTINRIERSCPVCTIGEANEVMSTAAAQLRGEAPATVKVRIATTPPGGQVVVDGAPVGTAPLELDLTAGEHTLSAALGDRTSGETRVTVAMPEDGTAQEVALELRGPPAPPPPPPGRRYGVFRWVGAGGAAALVAVGVTFVVLDGKGVDCAPMAAECPRVYDTMTGGLALTAVGLGAAGFTAYMFLHDRKLDRAATAAVVPTEGGATVVLIGRF